MNIELLLLAVATSGWVLTWFKYRSQQSKTLIIKLALQDAIKELKAESYRLRLLEAQGQPNVARITDVKKHISGCIADCQAVAHMSGEALQ